MNAWKCPVVGTVQKVGELPYSLIFKNGECSIRVYQVHNKYDDCFIRVLTSMVSVLLEY